ncbi:GNAT family N-acetyltransferase [Thermomonospora cellulosilytica]|uniref:RimJ/RimL family protein N-acetyltransferase n=1 Tax=Thermomonospora cellulosilytica TaxID=1411118 RepID=A0A7W3R9B8_9ACTN|nr:GNAT family N-acetyltransferase [Thermomonospora cellulosilytica]MBA9004636.1 RimJ/RimL family protein N-acetyltransferase [Thermomonospora cellulosilytica]
MLGPAIDHLTTPRLLLEPLTVEHAEEMVSVLDDPRLHAHIGGEPLTLEELRARYRHLVAGPAPFHQEAWLNWIVRRRRDHRPVGTVQATITPGPRAAVAWVVGMPYQGFGFATEAARAVIGWLRAHHITDVHACIHPDNAPSKAVARKLGLRPTRERAGDEVVWRPPPPGDPDRAG